LDAPPASKYAQYNSLVATYHVENFGCRATQADGAAIERQLLGRGLERASAAVEAEVVILNTCTVTASADQDARAAIRRIHRENPAARILVTGCYAQRAPEELSALPGVSLVVGNSHKHELASYAAPLANDSGFVALHQIGLNPASTVIVGDIFAHTELSAAPVFEAGSFDKTRPNLKVQDGCNNRCSFCIIPSVRGRSRSLKLEQVLREVDGLVANGYREIVLSGINLGRWGRELTPRMNFAAMLRAILERTAVEKIRISSVEPMDWTDEVIELVAASPRIAKHAHVPLQSGSDRILRRMHRKYRPWHYVDRIERIRSAMPDAAIGADVMVGFPGETADDFEQTRALIERHDCYVERRRHGERERHDPALQLGQRNGGSRLVLQAEGGGGDRRGHHDVPDQRRRRRMLQQLGCDDAGGDADDRGQCHEPHSQVDPPLRFCQAQDPHVPSEHTPTGAGFAPVL